MGRIDLDLRRRHAFGQRVQLFAGRAGAVGDDLQQARGGIDAVVEAVPAFGEEEVAAHLAGQLGLDLAHLRLDQRVPGLPHHRAAAVAQDVALQATAALDVVPDHSARIALEHVCGEQHQQAAGADVDAAPGEPAAAVPVAAEGAAHVGPPSRTPCHYVP